jgi:type IV secretion system protein VirD4
MALDPGKASLRDVRRLISADTSTLAAYVKRLDEQIPQSLAARTLRRFTEAINEISSIRSVAETQTAFLDNETLSDAMQTDAEPFNLDELASRKVTLYLVLPLDRLNSHGRWLRMLLTLTLTLTIRAISRQVKPPEIPVMFLLDEFGTVGPLRMIETAFGLLMGQGVVVWAFLQDLSQLQRDYPQSWETFIANSAVLQVLNARDKTTSEYFLSMPGRYSHTRPEYSEYGGRLIPEKEVSRELLYPDDIRRMSLDCSLLFYAGFHPILTRRAAYFQVPSWQGLSRPLPGFPASASPPGNRWNI